MIWGFKELLWAALALMFAVLLAYVLIITVPQWSQSEGTRGPSVYVTDPSPFDTHLTALDREALDEAYKKYRIGLFESWMKDPSKQPERAIFGAEKARTVYVNVLKAIEERPK